MKVDYENMLMTDNAVERSWYLHGKHFFQFVFRCTVMVRTKRDPNLFKTSPLYKYVIKKQIPKNLPPIFLYQSCQFFNVMSTWQITFIERQLLSK